MDQSSMGTQSPTAVCSHTFDWGGGRGKPNSTTTPATSAPRMQGNSASVNRHLEGTCRTEAKNEDSQ